MEPKPVVIRVVLLAMAAVWAPAEVVYDRLNNASLDNTESTPGSVRLSGGTNLTGYVLQESERLHIPGWRDSTSGSTNPISVPYTAPTRYFRLAKP